jgi:hypothetical protein
MWGSVWVVSEGMGRWRGTLAAETEQMVESRATIGVTHATMVEAKALLGEAPFCDGKGLGSDGCGTVACM